MAFNNEWLFRFNFLGGLIPLHNSCSFGHVDVVQALLLNGANPNAQDNWKFTPLHEAAIKGKADVCIGKRKGKKDKTGRVKIKMFT